MQTEKYFMIIISSIIEKIVKKMGLDFRGGFLVKTKGKSNYEMDYEE